MPLRCIDPVLPGLLNALQASLAMEVLCCVGTGLLCCSMKNKKYSSQVDREVKRNTLFCAKIILSCTSQTCNLSLKHRICFYYAVTFKCEGRYIVVTDTAFL